MFVEVDGLKINVKISGSGERTAVMLQGWGTNLELYNSVAASINDEYRFVQFDFPGFGNSDEPKEAWDVGRYTDFFIKLMEKLEIKEAALIGHSYGCRVIIKLAEREELPFNITKIVLMGAAGIKRKKTPSQLRKERRYKFLKKILLNRFVHFLFPEIIDDWKSRQGSEDYRRATPVMKKAMVMALSEDLTELLPKINKETLLIWGDKDTATPVSDAKIMEEKIKGSGLCVLEGCTHYAFLEKPAVFKNIMRNFFKVGVNNGN
ncbi:MAG: alpha/beta hydrolase [Lachnospiraceae bacterium]|nr:alpha/beta hydrolase [Lachnospiraceae bacterium]